MFSNMAEISVLQSTKFRDASKMYALLSRTRADDVQEAKALFQELFFDGTLGSRIRDAQTTFRKWSWNRVEELFRGTAPRVDAFELLTLRAMKEAKLLREGRLLRDARRGHAEFIAETERLAAMSTYGDEDFLSNQVQARRDVARGMDMPRTEDD